MTVEEIINTGFVFKIPDYQRGYRWGETEVKDLLTDINEIKDPEKTIEILSGNGIIEKYCLQPVVFDTCEEANNYMIVVDGQQRLTTLFLIISYISKLIIKNKVKLEDRFIEENNSKNGQIIKKCQMFHHTFWRQQLLIILYLRKQQKV